MPFISEDVCQERAGQPAFRRLSDPYHELLGHELLGHELLETPRRDSFTAPFMSR